MWIKSIKGYRYLDSLKDIYLGSSSIKLTRSLQWFKGGSIRLTFFVKGIYEFVHWWWLANQFRWRLREKSSILLLHNVFLCSNNIWLRTTEVHILHPRKHLTSIYSLTDELFCEIDDNKICYAAGRQPHALISFAEKHFPVGLVFHSIWLQYSRITQLTYIYSLTVELFCEIGDDRCFQFMESSLAPRRLEPMHRWDVYINHDNSYVGK